MDRAKASSAHENMNITLTDTWSLSPEHNEELEALFKKEDEWLKKEQLSSVRYILSHERHKKVPS